jgi:hypothetical protein
LGALERYVIEQYSKNKKYQQQKKFSKKNSGFDDSGITQNVVFLKSKKITNEQQLHYRSIH